MQQENPRPQLHDLQGFSSQWIRCTRSRYEEVWEMAKWKTALHQEQESPPGFPAPLRASQVFRQNLVWTSKLPPTAQMVSLETLHPCWSYDTGGMLPWGWRVMSSSTAICWAPSRGSPGFGSQLLSHSWLPYCSTSEMIKAKWLLGRQAGQHQSCFTLTEHALTFRKSKRVECSQNTLGTSTSHVGQNAQHCGKGIAHLKMTIQS